MSSNLAPRSQRAEVFSFLFFFSFTGAVSSGTAYFGVPSAFRGGFCFCLFFLFLFCFKLGLNASLAPPVVPNRMNTQLWNSDGTNYQINTTSATELPLGVYRLCESLSGPYLEFIGRQFQLPEKLYGMNRKFIDRVKRTYDSTEGNLGVLLNGIKGTGKTVTCEVIANELKKHVIIIDRKIESLASFLNQLRLNAVLFFDEFEKSFEGRAGTPLLAIMDGALKSQYRRLFLMTTNTLHIEDNMLQRPGRIRYVKSFGNLSAEAIEEILDDRLESIVYKSDVMEFVSGLELITVDIVCSICEEVNLHDESPQEFADCFNVKKLQARFNVYKEVNGEREKIASNIRSREVDGSWIDEDYYVERENMGEVIEVFDSRNFMVRPYKEDGVQPPDIEIILEPVFMKNPCLRKYDQSVE